MNPDPQTSGLFGFLNSFRRPNQTTGLNPIQNFAQALDPLILPSMRGGEAIRARGQQQLNEQTKNKTILNFCNNVQVQAIKLLCKF